MTGHGLEVAKCKEIHGNSLDEPIASDGGARAEGRNPRPAAHTAAGRPRSGRGAVGGGRPGREGKSYDAGGPAPDPARPPRPGARLRRGHGVRRPGRAGGLAARGRQATTPTVLPSRMLVVRGAGPRTRTVRLEDPALALAEDASGEDRLPGWAAPEDAEALAVLVESSVSVGVERLTVRAARPMAVRGSLRIAGRDRPGASGLWLELAWPAALRGTAARSGGVVEHAVLPSGTSADCCRARHACGAVTATPWCRPRHSRRPGERGPPRGRDPLARSAPQPVAGRRPIAGDLRGYHQEGNTLFIHLRGASLPSHPPMGRPGSLSMASRRPSAAAGPRT
ncbi:predicted protein [Streptomyces sp. C]|nr:predicted protein [Streptomyces sp. C]